jgi:hypothetical protein
MVISLALSRLIELKLLFLTGIENDLRYGIEHDV